MSAIDERVLERIRRDAGATNVGLLASDLRLKFPTVQKAVDRLIRTGRVERAEDGGLTTTIAEAREHAFNLEADRRYKAAVQSMPQPSKRHHATKKSPGQLQREIDEVLAKPVTASGVPSALTRWDSSHSDDVPLHSKYWYAVDQGTYHITPVSNPDQPRDVRYDLRFNKKPLGWEKIGPYHKTLKKAVSAAQRHYAALQ